MELRVLKYFLAVAREENITRAAEFLHITQPTLSRQLMQLEDELNAQLFIRGKNRITLTDEGMLLRRRAEEIVDLAHKTEKEFLDKNPKYTVERLRSTEQLVGDLKKKTFYVEDPQESGNQLVIFSFAKEKVVINNGLLIDDEVKISKKPVPFKFDTLYSEEATEIKDFKYTPNLKRAITIIDPETTEEIKPVLYYDEETDEVKGKCKLKPNKSYFAFEIRDDKN